MKSWPWLPADVRNVPGMLRQSRQSGPHRTLFRPADKRRPLLGRHLSQGLVQHSRTGWSRPRPADRRRQGVPRRTSGLPGTLPGATGSTSPAMGSSISRLPKGNHTAWESSEDVSKDETIPGFPFPKVYLSIFFSLAWSRVMCIPLEGDIVLIGNMRNCFVSFRPRLQGKNRSGERQPT